MATLRDIVEAILSDLTCAQNNANKLTRALASKYQADAVLQYLTVPNALLEEVEFTLSFAAEDDAISTSKAPSLPPGELVSSVRLRALAGELAHIVLCGVAEKIRGRAAAPGAGNQPGQAAANQRLADSLVASDSRQGVTNHLQPILQHFFRQQGEGNKQKIEDLLDAIKERLGDLLAAEDAMQAALKDVRKTVAKVFDVHREEFNSAIGQVRDALSQTDGPALEQLLSTRVVIDSANLSGLPEHAIQKLQLRARMKNYRWVVVDGDQQQLVPEND